MMIRSRLVGLEEVEQLARARPKSDGCGRRRARVKASAITGIGSGSGVGDAAGEDRNHGAGIGRGILGHEVNLRASPRISGCRIWSISGTVSISEYLMMKPGRKMSCNVM